MVQSVNYKLKTEYITTGLYIEKSQSQPTLTFDLSESVYVKRKTKGNLHIVSFLLKSLLSPPCRCCCCCFSAESDGALSSIQAALLYSGCLHVPATRPRVGCQVKVIWMWINVFTLSLSLLFCQSVRLVLPVYVCCLSLFVVAFISQTFENLTSGCHSRLLVFPRRGLNSFYKVSESYFTKECNFFL